MHLTVTRTLHKSQPELHTEDSIIDVGNDKEVIEIYTQYVQFSD